MFKTGLNLQESHQLAVHPTQLCDKQVVTAWLCLGDFTRTPLPDANAIGR